MLLFTIKKINLNLFRLIVFCLLLSIQAFGQCPALSCRGYTTTINYNTLPLCSSGTSVVFNGNIDKDACKDGTGKKCFEYIVQRVTATTTAEFTAKFGQGTACTGELDASYSFRSPNNCTTLSSGGSQTAITFSMPINVLEVKLYGCINSNSSVSLCGMCSGSTVLPVEITDFNAQNTDKSITINWRTSEEQNLNFFVVERSANGKDFKDIAEVKTGAFSKEYSFLDEKPLYGTNYYRLKMVENNTTQPQYSKTVSVTSMTKDGLKVTPSVTTNNIVVDMPQQTLGVVLFVTDITGKVIKSVKTNSLQETVDVSDLGRGMYLLVAQSGFDKHFARFIKQ